MTRISYGLIASLILNALLIGIIAGGVFSRTAKGPPPPPEAAISRALMMLPPDTGAGETQAALRKAFGEAREKHRQVRNARLKIGQILRAKTYDEDALREAFSDMNAAETAFKIHLQETLMTRLQAASPDERAALVRAVSRAERGSPGRGPHSLRGGGPRPDPTPPGE